MSSNVGSTISRDTEFQSASCLFFRVVLNSVVISAPIEWHKTTGFSPISSRGLRAFYISRSHLPDEIRSYIIVSESLESSLAITVSADFFHSKLEWSLGWLVPFLSIIGCQIRLVTQRVFVCAARIFNWPLPCICNVFYWCATFPSGNSIHTSIP